MKTDVIGNKIIILGCPGSGKSVFSIRLRELTGLPLYHLDNVWWNEDRTHISREEFDRKLQEIMAGDQWIIDGNYSRTYEARFACCDTVIFLDYPEEVCMAGIEGRIGKHREDMPWTENEPDPELVDMVRSYRSQNRPVVYALFEKYPDRKYLVFKSRTEAEEWLAQLKNE